MHDRARLREALADAIAAAEDAVAPDRVLALLRGAYRSLDSSRFVDDDMIRWAEAGLGAWRRWWSSRGGPAHRLLVVDADGELAAALREIAADDNSLHVEVVATRTATLEALATQTPTAVVFDLDSRELAPTAEILEWLATDFGQLRRVGYRDGVDAPPTLHDRGLLHAVLTKPPDRDSLFAALDPDRQARVSVA